MTTREIFPERLLTLRKKQSLTQQQVANELQISRVSLGLYESGQRLPDIEVLAKIAKYYNVSADYLLGRSEAKTLDTKVQDICEYTGLTEENVEKLHIKKTNEKNLSFITFSSHSANRKDALRVATNLMLEMFLDSFDYQLSKLGTEKAKHKAFDLAALKIICEEEGLPFTADEIEKHGKQILSLSEFTKRLTPKQFGRIGAIEYYIEKLKIDLPKIGELSLEPNLDYLTYLTEKTFSKYLNNIAELFAYELVGFYYQPYMQLLSLPTIEEQVEFAFHFSAQVEGSPEWYAQSTDRIEKLRELLREEEEKIGKHNKETE